MILSRVTFDIKMFKVKSIEVKCLVPEINFFNAQHNTSESQSNADVTAANEHKSKWSIRPANQLISCDFNCKLSQRPRKTFKTFLSQKNN